MSEDSQITVPPPFVARFTSQGQIKPAATQDVIVQRDALCGGFFQRPVQPAQTRQRALGITQDDARRRAESMVTLRQEYILLMNQAPAVVSPSATLTREQVVQALGRAGVRGVEDPGVVAQILTQMLAQTDSVCAALPFGLEPSHYRVALERAAARDEDF